MIKWLKNLLGIGKKEETKPTPKKKTETKRTPRKKTTTKRTKK
jgi:hypothetical protein